MESIVSYPDRGDYGRSSYRGNCSGKLIEDIIRQYNVKQLSDFMVGSGTTEDVVRRMGIEGTFADLNRGFDMLSMEIPERSQNVFWHPPYHDMIVYSGRQYSDTEVMSRYGFDPKVNDLSRCPSWEDFVKKMNYCMMKQFTSLEKGGRLFCLMGDIKRQGRLYSMLFDLIKPGTVENVIIKAQHNCVSSRTEYTGRSFVPIVHEYMLVVRKDASLVIPVSYGSHSSFHAKEFDGASWRDLVCSVLEDCRGEMSLEEFYREFEGTKKTQGNRFWKEKIRQVLQNQRYFRRTARGTYALASAA